MEGANGKFPELASFHSQEQVDAVIKMLPDPSELGTYLGVSCIPVRLPNRQTSTGIEPVMSHTNKSCIAFGLQCFGVKFGLTDYFAFYFECKNGYQGSKGVRQCPIN